jgi:amino acid adenylation domain-containing protein
VINVLEYLEATAARLPDKTAFIGEDATYTFARLKQTAQAVGSFIAAQGMRNAPVAILMPKGAHTVAAFLGVTYSGNYYVPLDVEAPALRIKSILETVRPKLIICVAATESLVQAENNILFEHIAQTSVNQPLLDNVHAASIDADPLYVVFTSGSTGTPKGVMANHRAVINYVDAMSAALGFNEESVFGVQVPLYVDACLKEIFSALKYGARAYLIPRQMFMFPVKLIEYINQNNINTLCWVSSALAMVSGLGVLDKHVPLPVRTVAYASEVFPPKQLNRWRDALPSARFFQLYGPTETTGVAMSYEITRRFDDDEAIPIGRPFKNYGIVLLTDDNQAPEPGEPGEINIRGAGLSMGYLNDPERTRQSFVQNPLSAFPDLMYKTGDMGYVNADGNYMFIARRDHQIKHMGHRIELLEIEWAVNQIEGIHMACAVFDEAASRIALYYTAEGSVTVSGILTHCKAALPRYMVPHACIREETLPLTPNGKIDRVKLTEKFKETHKKR